MTRSNPGLIFEPDPEVERSLHKNLRSRNSDTMAEQNLIVEQNNQHRMMGDYSRPSLIGAESSIARPRVEANNFEIKPNIIQMVQQICQFHGLPDEDPHAHITNFLEICDTFKINGATEDAIKLRLFPFSLRDRAKAWLKSMPTGSITTWNDLATKFLTRYFPPARTSTLRNDLVAFRQSESETLYEAWERFKDLLRKCPHHGFDLGFQMHIFHNGLNDSSKHMINASAGGTTYFKTPEQMFELVENIAMENCPWGNQKSRAKISGVHNVDAVTSLEAKLEALNRKIDNFSITPNQMSVMCCDICGGSHPNHECQAEQVDFVNNKSQNNPYSNTYNPGWRNHPNFSWSNSNSLSQPKQMSQSGFQKPQFYPQQQTKPNLEELLTKFISSTETRFQNQEASIHNLENQIGQLAKIISERPQGSLPSNTEPNPREQVNAISVQGNIEFHVKKKQEESVEFDKKVDEKPELIEERYVPEYKPKIPYPSKVLEELIEDSPYGNLLRNFKNLHINIPFVHVLLQVPKYANLLEEIFSNKKRFEADAQVMLNEECPTILPKKLNDPGSFLIPCHIGSISDIKALADLGASVNLMPYHLFKELGLHELKSTRINVQMADKSIKHPRGLIEDVLVKIDKFIFPVDFVVLDMDENIDVPIILGRPFLATAKTNIDVESGELTLRIADAKVVFQISEPTNLPIEKQDACFENDSELQLSQILQEITVQNSKENYVIPAKRKERENADEKMKKLEEKNSENKSSTGKIVTTWKKKLKSFPENSKELELKEIKDHEQFVIEKLTNSDLNSAGHISEFDPMILNPD